MYWMTNKPNARFWFAVSDHGKVEHKMFWVVASLKISANITKCENLFF